MEHNQININVTDVEFGWILIHLNKVQPHFRVFGRDRILVHVTENIELRY